MAERVAVEPTMLEWARKSAGFDEEAAAKKLSVSRNSLQKWESGDLEPTIKQLRKAAKCYGRPLAVLLLPEPPKDFDALRDFRRAGQARDKDWSPPLHAEFKRAMSQREVFLELAELAPSVVESTEFPVKADPRTKPEDLAAAFREALEIDKARFDPSQPHDILNAYVGAVEALGIIVIHTRAVDTDEMRAFSVSEWPFPVIALNGTDWPRARLFSLLHELTHLALNAGGLCDLHDSEQRSRTEDQIEHFCNAVAGAVLMPADAFIGSVNRVSKDPNHEWTVEELFDFSREFGASSESVLLRLIELGRASWALYAARKPELDKHYMEAREREKAKQKETTGGPSYYVVKTRDLGHGYVTGVLSAFDARAISSLDVADYLDIRFDQLPKLEEAVRR